MSIVTYEGLVWLIGAVVCLCAAPRVQLFASAGNGWPHNAPRYHLLMPISCHFRDCKAFLVTSLRVSSAIASTRPLPLSGGALNSAQPQPLPLPLPRHLGDGGPSAVPRGGAPLRGLQGR